VASTGRKIPDVGDEKIAKQCCGAALLKYFRWHTRELLVGKPLALSFHKMRQVFWNDHPCQKIVNLEADLRTPAITSQRAV
jgi:hypothetical protein